MVASKHINASASFGYGGNFGAGIAGHNKIDELLAGAQDLLLRAPEITVILGERAAAAAKAAQLTDLWIRAEGLVVSARIRLGYRASTVPRALEILRIAQKAGLLSLAARTQVDLAVCARSVGLPTTGLTPLRAALADPGLSALWRVTGLTSLVGCMSDLGPREELEDLFAEADNLCLSSDELSDVQTLLSRALVRNGSAAYHRRHGDLGRAVQEAKAGCDFLDRLPSPASDGKAVRARLILHLVSVLLDRGELDDAVALAQPLLRTVPRAGVAAPVGWLQVAIATRVLLPTGAGIAALSLLRTAKQQIDTEQFPALSAQLSLELASAEEHFGDPTAAIADLRHARFADQVRYERHRRARDLLRAEFGDGQPARGEFERMLSPAKKSEPATAPLIPINNSGPQKKFQSAQSWESPQDFSRSDNSVSWKFSIDPPRVEKKNAAPFANGSQPKPIDVMSDSARQNTRHDDVHGSEAAQSVLDRLGISGGFNGGKRRASGRVSSEMTDPSLDSSLEFRRFLDSVSSFADSAEAPSGSASASEENHLNHSSNGMNDNYSSDDSSSAYSFASSARSPLDGWLPKLRLPPSLAPIENLSAKSDISVSSPRDSVETDFSDLAAWGSVEDSTAGRYEDSFSTDGVSPDYGVGSGYDTAIAAEDPPADAGLADLLARALAEHRAGTASAAALVKRLGEHNGTGSASQRVNGYGRSESRANGRHRNQA